MMNEADRQFVINAARAGSDVAIKAINEEVLRIVDSAAKTEPVESQQESSE